MEGSAAAPFITFQSVRLGLRSKNKPEAAYFTYSLASRSHTLHIGVAGDLGKAVHPERPVFCYSLVLTALLGERRANPIEC